MKFSLALVLILFTFHYVDAQQQSVTIKNGTLSGNNYSKMDSYYSAFNGETIILTDETKGSPYLNPKFQLGSIQKNGEIVMDNIALRYNAYNDIILGKKNLQTPDAESLNVIKSADYQIQIGDQLFVAVPTNKNAHQLQYYQLIFQGEKNTLYLKHTSSYKERIQATTSMTRDAPAMFKMRSDFYLKDASGLITELPSSKKKIAKLFGANESKVKKFIKENKIDTDEEKDLFRLFEYINTL